MSGADYFVFEYKFNPLISRLMFVLSLCLIVYNLVIVSLTYNKMLLF